MTAILDALAVATDDLRALDLEDRFEPRADDVIVAS